jgi:hypothetical protein
VLDLPGHGRSASLKDKLSNRFGADAGFRGLFQRSPNDGEYVGEATESGSLVPAPIAVASRMNTRAEHPFRSNPDFGDRSLTRMGQTSSRSTANSRPTETGR